jgi:hypothetical protein
VVCCFADDLCFDLPPIDFGHQIAKVGGYKEEAINILFYPRLEYPILLRAISKPEVKSETETDY